MEDWQEKQKGIPDIIREIHGIFGEDFFDFTDFWDGDNIAIGIKRKDTLVYISGWGEEGNYTYYLEIERIDPLTCMPLEVMERVNKLPPEAIIKHILAFVTQHPIP
ncbi:hypothetical protein [Chitinophaga arvensicola]|uniref:Uncharacterized protein n=1 Tax=Chitinophaga arvensicola TaxID=29529 RepID=A0A1I0RFD3_9BACT|nr:hypothetical protein [Chitinophaga arvensicola]SEW39615.1 hypothetical protein SAMN04488122_2766 [Chitinophaga arvensicola]